MEIVYEGKFCPYSAYLISLVGIGTKTKIIIQVIKCVLDKNIWFIRPDVLVLRQYTNSF